MFDHIDNNSLLPELSFTKCSVNMIKTKEKVIKFDICYRVHLGESCKSKLLVRFGQRTMIYFFNVQIC